MRGSRQRQQARPARAVDYQGVSWLRRFAVKASFTLVPPPLCSIVVPCFNEEAVIRKTHERLMKFIGRETSCRFEVLYVDDGSRDGTFALLQGFQAAEPRVRVLALSRNFGHQVAVTAGLEHAAGHAVVVMDADLQDPPEVIPGHSSLGNP